MDIRWIKTNAYVIASIRIAHKDELTLYSTFTNPEPSHLSSTPIVETAYCLKNCETFLIKYITTWDHGKREETEKHQYFLGIGIQE